MSSPRLTTALENGALVLPDTGRIAVLRPPAAVDLSSLPTGRVQIIQPFKPDHDTWAARGYDTARTPKGVFAVAIVCVPRAKALARALVEQATRIVGGGIVVLDGQKTDGIEPALKAVKARVALEGVIAKSHGKLAWFAGGDFTDWAVTQQTVEGGFVTSPGVFSADGPDKGSVALAAALPATLAGRGADLGAGWGFLSRAILDHDGVTSLDLVEADADALECARANLSDPRIRFVWADAMRHRPDASYDFVVMNPPFHTGRAGDPALGRAFIHAAAAMLAPKGVLWMVANRHLPYETDLSALFAEVAEHGGSPGFKILCAAKPRRQARPNPLT